MKNTEKNAFMLSQSLLDGDDRLDGQTTTNDAKQEVNSKAFKLDGSKLDDEDRLDGDQDEGSETA